MFPSAIIKNEARFNKFSHTYLMDQRILWKHFKETWIFLQWKYFVNFESETFVIPDIFQCI